MTFSNIYFIADTHIGTESMRTVAKRGFGSNWEKHEEVILQGINRVINKNSLLYILGDVGSNSDYVHLKEFLCKIKTKKVFLLLGNHDNEYFFQMLRDEHVILGYDKIHTFKNNKVHFTLCHYPLFEWEGFFSNGIHLYGHVHNNTTVGWKSLDVGVDNIGYTPMSIKEIVQHLEYENNVDTYRNKVFLDKRY